MEFDQEIIEEISGIVSKATDSKEFLEYCNKEIQQGKVPTKLLQLWTYGCRTHYQSYNKSFMDMMYEVFVEKEDQQFLSVAMLDKEISEASPDFNTVLASQEQWSLEYQESQNKEKFQDYFPAQEQHLSPSFHALFTHMGFDSPLFKTKKEFAVVMSIQPPVNNRDFNILRAKPDKYGKPSMFCWCTNKPTTAMEKASRFQTGAGHYMLAKRVRREDVQDDKLRPILSSYTTMFKVSSMEGSNFSRTQGEKLVGDPVGLNAKYEDMCKLFQLLTVSKYFHLGLASKYFSTYTTFEYRTKTLKKSSN